MKTLLIISIFVILSIVCKAQFSEVKFYQGDSVYKTAISFNENTIYCLGILEPGYSDKYELYKSVNQGLNWSIVNATESFLNTSNFVSFSDSIHISIGKNTILKTYDAFDTSECIMCSHLPYPTTIKAVNKDTVLIYDMNKIYLSYDCFDSWDTIDINSVTSKYKFAIDDISIINDSVWIAYLSYDCALIKTTNSGTDWHMLKDLSVYSFCNNEIYVNFYSENDGILSIEEWIYITHNGANTFQKVLGIKQNSLIDMNIFSSGWCYVVTEDKIDSSSTIYYSKNYGNSWDSLVFFYQNPNDGIYNLNYYNDSLVFALSYNGKMFRIDMSTVGLKENIFSSHFVNLYPNPTSDFLNVEIEGVKKWEYHIQTS